MAMEVQHERPPAYMETQPERIVWPAIPQHAPHHTHAPSDITLPDLKTILSAEFEQQLSPAQSIRDIHHHYAHGSPMSIRSLPRIDPGYNLTPHDASRTSEASMVSPAETGSVMSTDENVTRSTSVVSMDDPDVRIAAEALSGLGNLGAKRQTPLVGGKYPWADYAHSPRRADVHALSHGSPEAHTPAPGMQVEQEPLLELIAQAHPWVGGTIKGSLSAYSTTKHYSPRIVQYGANLVERNITIPVVSAVSSVGEMTGVESNLRRYLDSRRPNELEAGQASSDNSRKRKVLLDAPTNVDAPYTSPAHLADIRRDSIESRTEPLPRYGASRPPSYREEDPVLMEQAARQRPSATRSWSSQIFVTTSGLSVALSATSRRSLRYSLGVLGHSADRVSDLTSALSMILQEYEKARANQEELAVSSAMEKGERPPTPNQNESARQLAEAIKRTSDDIWQTLRYVVNSVSNYAGGALPENAREFVRQQLMSLPQRWRVVSDGQSGDSETSRSAQRMIDFAREGLDMMTQVSGVLKATLESAEKWLERVGRRERHSDVEDQVMTDAPWQQPARYDEKS